MPTTVTKTVKPSGGDYSSLSAWEAGQQADLVAADQIQQAECYAMSDTAFVAIYGWTTDATRYIRIYTPPGERHDGKWNAAKYRLEVSSGTFGYALDIYAENVRVEGLQVSQSTTNEQGAIAIQATGTLDIRISYTIAKVLYAGAKLALAVTSAASGGGTVKVWNSLVYGTTTSGQEGISTRTSSNTLYVYNCTAVNLDIGYRNQTFASSNMVAKNCLANDCTDGFYAFTGWGAASTNNASDIASDAPGSSPQTGEVAFVSEGNFDFHLAPADAVAKDAGTDLSADAIIAFPDDIEGFTRSTWDIGASELLSTCGKTTVGATADTYPGNYLAASKVTMTEAGTVRRITVYADCLGATTGPQSFKAGVYADSGGVIGALLGFADVVVTLPDDDPGAWHGVTLGTPLALAAGDYHIAEVFSVAGSGSPLRLFYDAGSGSSKYTTSGVVYPTFNDPFPSSPSSLSYAYSAYLSYTPTGAGGGPLVVVAPAASLTLSAPAPALAAAAAATAAQMTLTALAPALRETVVASPAVMTLTAPPATVAHAAATSSATLTLTAPAPALRETAVAAAAVMTLSAPPPAVAQTAVAAAATLTLTAPAPSLAFSTATVAATITLIAPPPSVSGGLILVKLAAFGVRAAAGIASGTRATGGVVAGVRDPI